MRKLQAAGYSEISYFIDRQRQSLAIDDAIASWISEE
jgi:hypothetical protein